MSAVVDTLLAPDVRPFAVAAAIIVVLAGIELLATMVGFSISHVMGHEIDLQVESHNAFAGLLFWINAGRVPVLILILLALGVFSIEGFFLQAIARHAGMPLPVWIASLAATAGTIPVVRLASRGISRMIPRDETYAVNEADFVGQVAVVSIGPLDQGLPGRVRLKDVFGNWHTVPARASHDSLSLPVGASVLLVDRDAKGFIAISAPEDLTAHQH
jgi:Protein of unknown function (DUF1449)